MAKYKLDDLCEFITDGTHQTPEYCDGGGVIFLSSKDVTERKINWDNVKHIPYSLHEKLCKRLNPRKDDILLAKNGTTGVAAIVDRDEVFDVYVSLALLRPLDTIYPRYLLYAINSPIAKRQFNAGLKGIGVPNLHLGVIRKTVINVADREEQEKICEILDKVATVIDNRKTELDELDNLIKARFVELFGDFDLSHPKTNWKPISEIGTVVGGATPKTSVEEYWNGEYRWISPAELRQDSGVIYDSIKKITRAGIDSCSLQELPIGTVILSSRAPIGKVAIAGNTFYCNQGFKNIVCKENIIPRYLYSLLLFNTDYLNSLGRGATFKEISKSIVEKILIPVPAKKIQIEFENFCSRIDKSKVAVQKALDETQMLFDSLMQKYFG